MKLTDKKAAFLTATLLMVLFIVILILTGDGSGCGNVTDTTEEQTTEESSDETGETAGDDTQDLTGDENGATEEKVKTLDALYDNPCTGQYGIPVVAIWTDEEAFNGENGIYQTTNFYEEKERILSFTQVYSKSGELKSAAYTNLSMHGTGSLEMDMKSMRLYYDRDLTKEANPNRLYYNLFDDEAVDVTGQAIHSFRHIILRNGGNDNAYSMMRDLLAAKICRNLRADVMAGQPVLVYVNGEFQGLYNARERFDRQYFASHYLLEKEDVTILEVPSPVLGVAEDARFVVAHGEEGDEEDFNDLVEYILSHDMTDSVNYEYVTDRLDVDSLIDVLCANSFFANADWGNNNVSVWRNKGTDTSHVDNRWRFLIEDLDYSMGLVSTVNWEVVDMLMAGNSFFGQMVRALMENAEFKNDYISRYEELLATDFSYSNTIGVLQELSTQMQNVIQLNIEKWGAPADYATWEEQVSVIRNFLKKRGSYAADHLNCYEE